VILRSALDAMLLDMMVLTLRDYFAEYTYQASEAGLNLSIYNNNGNCDALVMRIRGFSEKAPILLSYVLMEVAQLFKADLQVHMQRLCEVTTRQAEVLERSYADENVTVAQASRNCRLLCLQQHSFPTELKLQLLLKEFGNNEGDETHGVQLLHKFVRELLAHAHIDLLVEGNMTAYNAVHLLDGFLPAVELSNSAANILEVTRIPSAGEIVLAQMPSSHLRRPYLLIRTCPSNLNDKNICVELYYQFGVYTIVDASMLELFEQIVCEPFFDNIRTKQQVDLLQFVVI
jgi:nardilysin